MMPKPTTYDNKKKDQLVAVFVTRGELEEMGQMASTISRRYDSVLKTIERDEKQPKEVREYYAERAKRFQVINESIRVNLALMNQEVE